MTQFLDITRAKRKENYDFLNQIMNNHLISFESLVSPPSSQRTDNIIKLVNNNTQQSEPIHTQSDRNEYVQSDEPIINEIDSIIDRIKNKYKPQEFKSTQKKSNKSSPKKSSPKKQISPEKPRTPPKKEICLMDFNEEVDQVPKKQSNIKEQVKRLKSAFKSDQKPPVPNIEQPKSEQLIDLSKPQESINDTAQFHEINEKFQTPPKYIHQSPDMSYSESSEFQSNFKSLIQETQPVQFNYYDDPILNALIQEEIELSKRLNELQQMTNI